MADEPPVTEEIFPQGSNKSYALVELVHGEGPMVGKGPEETLFSFPIVLMWEIILLLGVTLAIFLFSLIKQAPLDEIANPLITTDPAKAPWYFVGLQELLEHMHPMLAGVVIPTLLIAFLIILPYIDQSRVGVGVWFATPRGKRITFTSAVYTLIAMPTYIILDNAFTLRELLRGIVPQWVAQGLIPAGILLVLVAIPLFVLWRMKANRHDMIMASFTIMLVAAAVFTASGFFFRGPGFRLYVPWNMPEGYNPWDEL